MPITILSRCHALRFEVVPVQELTVSQLAAWQELATDPLFSSPFFSPGYSQLVGRCTENVMAGLMILNNKVVGVFPYELEAPGKGCPVGSIYCDYQATLVRPDISWCVSDLLAGISLNSFRFDHLLANQQQWAEFHSTSDVSWLIDLSLGFSAYEASLRRAKRNQLVQSRRKRRMLEREIGPLSFAPHVVDHLLLDELLAWKSEEWRQSGWPGRFKANWEQQLMHWLLETNYPDFAGLFTVLRAGGRPVAMHLGMRSGQVWHYWTTAYDREFKKYSPGIVMLVEILRHADRLALREFDMGKENFEYKRRLHTHVVPLAEGIAYAATMKHEPTRKDKNES